MKAKILITGASGFVGQNLMSYLAKHQLSNSQLSRGELKELDRQVLDNVETVIHLAGKAHDLRKTANEREYYEVNYDLTKNLYDVFLRSEAKKFIFISSVKAAADVVDGVLREDFVPDPKTPYGKSKLMAEAYIQAQPLPAGKAFYILRPCMIHGPNNKGNLNLLYQVVKKGIPYPLAAFKNRRSFLSVDNLSFVIKELICQKDIPSGIYNLADDEALATTDVVAILGQSMGKKARLLNIPQFLIKLLAKVGGTLRLPINAERLNKLTENYEVSNQKIVHALKSRLPIQAREGLLLTASSFEKQ